MLSDQEKSRYLTPAINAYLAGLLPEDVDWFWMLIEEIQLKFPLLDHYLHPDNWIGIGIKPHGVKKGANYFYVGMNNMPQRFYGSVGRRKMQTDGFNRFVVDRKFLHQREDIQAWLNALKNDLKDFDMQGSGLRPIDYPQHTLDQPEDAVVIDKIVANPSEHKEHRSTTNQILYGAAGTGKTYALQEIQKKYIETLATQDQ